MDPTCGPEPRLYVSAAVPTAAQDELAKLAADADAEGEVTDIVKNAAIGEVRDLPYHGVVCVAEELPAAKQRFKAAAVFCYEREGEEVDDEDVMVMGFESLAMALSMDLWQPPTSDEDLHAQVDADDAGVHRIADRVYLCSLLGAKTIPADADDTVLLSLLDDDAAHAELTPPPGSKRMFMRDTTEHPHELLSRVRDAVAYIHDVLTTTTKRVVVHCMAGRSRSASIVACYLMHSHAAATAGGALDIIREARPWIEPNPRFAYELTLYEKAAGVKVGDAPPADVPELSFAPQFLKPIVEGAKRATARMWGKGDALDKIHPGALVTAVTAVAGDAAAGAKELGFAVLVITETRTLKAKDIDDELARTEGLKDAATLTEVLKQFYPDMRDDDELMGIHFQVVRELTHPDI